MPLGLNDWDVTPGNNNSAAPDGWPENTMQYSDVNNAGREGMAVMARYYKDTNGSLLAAGIADAYTLTLNEVNYSAYFTGLYFSCRIPATNTGASTINVTSNGVLGVATIVDRAGAALQPGALQSGGVYEFRYDGTNFQLMGTIVGSIAIPSGTFSTSDATDLVDVGNAVNVGAAAPASNPHVAVDPNSIQAKADGTTAAQLNLNPLGGAVELQGGKLTTAATGIQVQGTLNNAPTTDNLAQDATLSLRNTGGTQVGTVGFSSANSHLIMANAQQGGQVQLTGTAEGGGARSVFTGDPDGGASIFFGGSLALEIAQTSANIHSTADDAPFLGFIQDDNATRNGFIQFADTGLTIRQERPSGDVTIQARNTANTLNHAVFNGDPDGSGTFYYNGLVAAQTVADGFDIRDTSGTTTTLRLRTSAGVEQAILQSFSGNTVLRSIINSDVLSLQGTNSGTNTRTLVQGDPDGFVQLYHPLTNAATAETAAAASGGFQINNTLTGGGFERALTTSDGSLMSSLASTAALASDAAPSVQADFTTALEASTTYSIEALIRYEAPGATGGFRLQFDYTGSFATASGVMAHADNGTTDGGGLTSFMDFPGGNATGVIMVKGSITTTTAANFQLLWSQETSNATSINFVAGSWLKLQKLP